jgi:hypothetical protein
MGEREPVGGGLMKAVSSFFGHVTAIVVGLILMIVGLAMGVTIVMLPVGIPVGLGGVLLFIWGLVGYSSEPGAGGKPTSPS